MVRSKDDDRIVQLPGRVHGREDAPDLVVHQRAEGVVAGGRFREVVPVEVVPDALDAAIDAGAVGQRIVETGRAGQVGRVVARTVFLRHDIGVVRRERADKERPGLVRFARRALDELDAARIE